MDIKKYEIDMHLCRRGLGSYSVMPGGRTSAASRRHLRQLVKSVVRHIRRRHASALRRPPSSHCHLSRSGRGKAPRNEASFAFIAQISARRVDPYAPTRDGGGERRTERLALREAMRPRRNDGRCSTVVASMKAR